jgi:hypothetical protein
MHRIGIAPGQQLDDLYRGSAMKDFRGLDVAVRNLIVGESLDLVGLLLQNVDEELFEQRVGHRIAWNMRVDDCLGIALSR